MERERQKLLDLGLRNHVSPAPLRLPFGCREATLPRTAVTAAVGAIQRDLLAPEENFSQHS